MFVVVWDYFMGGLYLFIKGVDEIVFCRVWVGMLNLDNILFIVGIF